MSCKFPCLPSPHHSSSRPTLHYTVFLSEDSSGDELQYDEDSISGFPDSFLFSVPFEWSPLYASLSCWLINKPYSSLLCTICFLSIQTCTCLNRDDSMDGSILFNTGYLSGLGASLVVKLHMKLSIKCLFCRSIVPIKSIHLFLYYLLNLTIYGWFNLTEKDSFPKSHIPTK